MESASRPGERKIAKEFVGKTSNAAHGQRTDCKGHAKAPQEGY